MAKASYVPNPAKIKVIGLGGGGCNVITRMVREGVRGVEFIGMNTDAQALALSEAPIRVQLGEKITRGLGAGGSHIVGQKAAEESRDEIRTVLAGADMVFVTAGMGGGTGTGSAPVVADVARQNGALTIGVVTKPFSFEGRHRSAVAQEGINNLLHVVDTLVIIPNDRMLTMVDQKTSVDSAFKLTDNVLLKGVQAIAEVITVPGVINLDFADVKAIMKDAGPAWMSVGRGSGAHRAIDAAKEALNSPMLDVAIEGARGVLFNIIGDDSLTLFEVNEAAKVIKQAVDPDANIIFGVAHDDDLKGEVSITLVATGFNSPNRPVVWGTAKDDEIVQYLTDLRKSEEEMDTPSFLRRPTFGRRRDLPIPAAPDKQADKAATKTGVKNPVR
jgi:cell division protein FtsZ